MKSHASLLCAAALAPAAVITLSSSAEAQIPQMISYQGRIAANGVNFHGTGQFKFALVRGNYAGNVGEPFALWTNDGSGGTVDPNVVPTASVSLACDKGQYSVLLGNTGAGMVAIPPSAFGNPDVRLRVWFNDGTNGFQLLTPDQRLVSTGYAMIAESAMNVPDGSINALKIANGAVGVTQLANGAVTNAKLGDGSVSAAKLGDGSVTSGKILDFSVNADKIAAGAISQIKIANGAVGTAQIATAAVGSAQIGDGSVAYADLAINSVKTAEIVDGEVRTSDLADGNVTGVKMADSSVSSAKIVNGTITAADVAGETLTGQEIANGTISAVDMASDTITAQEIAANAVGSSEIANASIQNIDLAYNVINTGEIIDGAVATPDLADLSVTNAKIGAGAVNASKIQSASITASQIALNTITASEIATSAVGTLEILDSSVTTQDLANSAVTTAKLATVPAVKLTISDSIQIVPAGNAAGSLTIPWDVEEYDTAAMHNPANPTAISAPVKGIYRLTVWADESTGVGRRASLRIYKNGAVVPNYLHVFASEEEQHYGGSIELALNAGDYLQIETVLSRTNDFVYPMYLSTSNKSTHCSMVFVTPLP